MTLASQRSSKNEDSAPAKKRRRLAAANRDDASSGSSGSEVEDYMPSSRPRPSATNRVDTLTFTSPTVRHANTISFDSAPFATSAFQSSTNIINIATPVQESDAQFSSVNEEPENYADWQDVVSEQSQDANLYTSSCSLDQYQESETQQQNSDIVLLVDEHGNVVEDQDFDAQSPVSDIMSVPQVAMCPAPILPSIPPYSMGALAQHSPAETLVPLASDAITIEESATPVPCRDASQSFDNIQNAKRLVHQGVEAIATEKLDALFKSKKLVPTCAESMTNFGFFGETLALLEVAQKLGAWASIYQSTLLCESGQVDLVDAMLHPNTSLELAQRILSWQSVMCLCNVFAHVATGDVKYLIELAKLLVRWQSAVPQASQRYGAELYKDVCMLSFISCQVAVVFLHLSLVPEIEEIVLANYPKTAKCNQILQKTLSTSNTKDCRNPLSTRLFVKSQKYPADATHMASAMASAVDSVCHFDIMSRHAPSDHTRTTALQNYARHVACTLVESSNSVDDSVQTFLEGLLSAQCGGPTAQEMLNLTDFFCPQKEQNGTIDNLGVYTVAMSPFMGIVLKNGDSPFLTKIANNDNFAATSICPLNIMYI